MPVADLRTKLADFDALIDFTSPAATLAHLEFCAANGKHLIIGTTGFDEAGKAAIAAAAKKTAIVFAPNMSVGVNLCFKLLELAAKVIGEESDIEIRQSFEAEEFGAEFTPELRAQEDRIREQAEKNQNR